MSTAVKGKSKGKGKASNHPAVRGRGGGARTARKQAYEEELKQLEEGIQQLKPRPMTLPTKFTDLPLSQATLSGLQSAYFHTLTPIQAKSLPYSLKKQDVLGAARTGSGKTLAFLVPVLEQLYRNKWGPNDGLGALVISPTRELAVQIFEVLRKIGHQHSFSAGLVIGGKSLKEEQDRLTRMNILIATPGRLLQHMDQTLSFDTSNLQLLVLDEADRILDMGFSKTLDAILANLPPSSIRQTLLFSATQTSNVQSLARLSLNEPVYVNVRDAEMASTSTTTNTSKEGNGGEEKGASSLETPKGLEQFYMIVDLDKKLDILWSFVKSHLACKTLVFMSSGKQVRFAYETFRHLRPGIPLLHIHGKQKQSKRLEIYSRFMSSSKCVLFATDVAARGLDFPSVNWVVQLDCPEDIDTYVHRVGRTARYNQKGKALLMLMQNEEEGFLKRVKENKLEGQLKNIRMNQAKQQTIQKQFQSLAFKFPEIKFLGQRAFISYIKSLHLQKDKMIFKKEDLLNKELVDLDKFATSLGLPGAPKIKFLNKKEASEKKNKTRVVEAIKVAPMKDFDSDEEDEEEKDEEEEEAEEPVTREEREDDETSSDSDEVETDSEDAAEEPPEAVAEDAPILAKAAVQSKTPKYDKMYKRKNQGILSDHYAKVIERDEDQDDGSKLSLLGGGDDEQEDFITLARPRHDLKDEDGADLVDGDATLETLKHEDLSKRRTKLGITKKGLLKLRGQGEKLVFDDEGKSHAIYELLGEAELGDQAAVEAERRKFVEEESRRMQEVDVQDKEAIKNMRREKKMKRKEREREVRLGRRGAEVADLMEGEEGVKEIDFDLPSEEEDEQEEGPKRGRQDEEDELELQALRALKRGRR